MAEVIDDPISLEDAISGITSLESWVKSKTDEWREFYESNYAEKDEEYARLFRGIWDEQDRTRDSEKSHLVSPATLQAVESAAAEIEEAVFGRGRFFDVRDDVSDQEKNDMVAIRNMLHEEFDKRGFKAKIREVILTSAIYGNGMAEVITEEIIERKPATRPVMGGQLQSVGVESRKTVVCDIVPLQPRNFLIDPAATSIDNALGVAVDRIVSPHTIHILQEKGVYLNEGVLTDVNGGQTQADADQELLHRPKEETRLLKYFGLVPRDLLEQAQKTRMQEEAEEDDSEDFFGLKQDDGDSYYVEAIVVMTQDGCLLKAEKNPHMMEDRDILNFTWDTLPGMFRGRGVVEKGYNTQKALDVELRGRADAMAYTIHPMLAMDATKFLRGVRPEVRPGKIIPVHGDPRTAMMPFTFGEVSQITFPQQQALEGMHQRATGAVDILPTNVQGETPAAAVSMTKSAIVKRFKRTQANFEEQFLKPLVYKVAWRKMQYDPENFPVMDYKFCVTGTLGTIAREYEVGQLAQILQATGPDSPLFLPLVEGMIEHLSLSNREMYISRLREASKPDPEAQQRAQEAHQTQMAMQAAQIAAFEGTAKESEARAQRYLAEASAVPEETQIKLIDTALKYQDDLDPGFKQQLEMLKAAIEERRTNIKQFEAETKRILARKETNDPNRRSVGGIGESSQQGAGGAPTVLRREDSGS